jgi:putative oxidoreductase
MAVGLLLLRMVLGAVIIGHGCQKALGWFHGPGITRAAALFESWGIRPGHQMVMLAAACEIAGGALALAGLATPLAAAMLTGTLIVASAPVARNGIWAAHGGFELAFGYASMAAVLGFTGAGPYSIDRVTGLPYHTWYGAAALAAAVTGSTVPLLRRRRALLDRAAPQSGQDPEHARQGTAAASGAGQH